MNSNKGKIFLIIGLVVLLLGIPLGIIFLGGRTSFRLGATDPNQPESVKVSAITENSAIVSWTTKSAVQGLISYGLSATNLTLIQPETSPTANHQVELTRLLPQSNYYFVIKVGEKVFDNNGQPFSFITQTKKETQASPTPTVKTPSSLNENDLEAAMGTNNPMYDLNKDGIVNTLDLLLFRQRQK